MGKPVVAHDSVVSLDVGALLPLSWRDKIDKDAAIYSLSQRLLYYCIQGRYCIKRLPIRRAIR
jgi:hypothetical protein